MEWIDVSGESGNLAALAHDGTDLFVAFQSGWQYRYFGVDESILQRILNKEVISKSKDRPSLGATFDLLVKKAGYEYERIK